MISEQMFCSKCGKTNWSKYFETCSCKEPDFSCKTYEEYLERQRNFENKILMEKHKNKNVDRYITLDRYKKCNPKFKTDYQDWWLNNIKIGDKFWLCDEDKHDLSELHCVTSKLVADITRKNYDGSRIGIPTIETLTEFIEYKTGCIINIEYYSDIDFKISIADTESVKETFFIYNCYSKSELYLRIAEIIVDRKIYDKNFKCKDV